MSYSNQVLNHYEDPRGVGSFEKDNDTADIGIVGALAYGDVTKLQIRINEQGVTEDAKSKTYGCGSTIASSSPVTEQVKGKTLGQVLEIHNTVITEELALPPVKIHCSILAEGTVKVVVTNYKEKHGSVKQKAV